MRQVVDSAIELLAPFDEPLNRVIGVKPAEDHLAPLAADWEILETLGGRIMQLGINDFVTLENLFGGVQWLQASWAGTAAEAFTSSASSLGQSVATRSSDLDAVSKIVSNGGVCLERLVYNQAMSWSDGLTQPMSLLGFTLPLAAWAQLIDRPMNESDRSQIVSAVDALTSASDLRQNAITTMVGRICKVLDYTPGRAIPTFSATDFEVPDKVIVDFGVRRYGFGNNVWWESSVAAPA